MPPQLEIQKIFFEQAKSVAVGAELLPGGVEELAKRLQKSTETQTPLKVKLGLDPTRPDLHLGHSVVLRKLRMFQDLGHQAILIIGDATAMIGDPSGRNQTRPPLTEAEIEVNAQTYLDQAGKIIDVRKAIIRRNSEWLKGMRLKEFLELSAQVTVAQMLARDDFAKRYQEGLPLSVHELFYPMMQSYDSVEIEADIELGGTDQRFNNLLGREMQLAYWRLRGVEKHNPPQMVLLMPLLEGTDGKVKMSKSYPEHCINLTDVPEEMYGKLMSIPDEMIPRYESLLTPMTEAQIEQQMAMMGKPPEQGGLNPRDVKAYMAKWVVGQFHGPEAGDRAEQAFIQQFRNKALPDDIPEITLPASTDHHLPTLLSEHELAASKGEARRLIEGGGVKLHLEGDVQEKITDADFQLNRSAGTALVLQAGKRRFLRIRF